MGNININNTNNVQDLLVDVAVYGTDRVTCQDILSQLEKHNICTYMKEYYHNSQCKLIDIIFNQIILKKYVKEYQNQISMELVFNQDVNDSDSSIAVNEYECLLFNQENLVPNIFQYTDCKTLCNCSLVSFLWLFHAFNINSLQRLLLELAFANEDKNEKEKEKEKEIATMGSLTMWQRFLNVKDVFYDEYSVAEKANHCEASINQFLTYFACLTHIEKVGCMFCERITSKDLLVLDIVSKQSDK